MKVGKERYREEGPGRESGRWVGERKGEGKSALLPRPYLSMVLIVIEFGFE